MILRHACLVLTVLVAPLSSSPHCPHCCEYGSSCRDYPDYPFLPAPPGKTPPCAKHGATYCEKVDRYPAHLIRYLVDHWGYDFNTLLRDETRDVYRPRILAPYGPSPGYHYGPPQHVSPPYTFYPQSHFAGNTINFTHKTETTTAEDGSKGEGYPDRRYPLGHTQPFLNDEDPGYIYSALLQPQVTHYNPADWWKRYTRSPETRSKKKVKKRQADLNGDIQLCPTTSEFIVPKAALNNKGNWMYIVNLDQEAAGANQNKYMQRVLSETCITNVCNGICTLPNGYTSRCEQQYVQKRLVALEGGGNQLYTDIFWFPHSCVCKISPLNNG